MTRPHLELVTEAGVAVERALVGSVLVNPDNLSAAGDLQASDFSDPRWGRIWAAMAAVHAAGREIDTWTVHAELDARGFGEAIPVTWLTEAAVNSGGATEVYASEVREASMTRAVLIAASGVREAHDRGARGTELLSAAQSLLANVRDVTVDTTATLAQVLGARAKELMVIADALAAGKPMATGIPTGIAELDAQTGGLQPGIVTALAGRPGMGKSAVAMKICRTVSRSGGGVHVFSLEDTRAAYADRILSAAAKVSAQRIRTMQGINREHLGGFNAAADYSRKVKWLVDDRSGLDAEEIVRKVRRYQPSNDTRLVVVDYVQLLARRNREDIKDMVTRSMQAFMSAARADNTAWLVLAQVNREAEKTETKKPSIRHLKESGAIEEQSKCVLLLFRPGYYDANADQKELEIIIAKNNNGVTGSVAAKFHGETMGVE